VLLDLLFCVQVYTPTRPFALVQLETKNPFLGPDRHEFDPGDDKPAEE